jgi:hypothetical protein
MKRYWYCASIFVAILLATGIDISPAPQSSANQAQLDERRLLTAEAKSAPASPSEHPQEAHAEFAQLRQKLVRFWHAYRAMHAIL